MTRVDALKPQERSDGGDGKNPPEIGLRKMRGYGPINIDIEQNSTDRDTC